MSHEHPTIPLIRQWLLGVRSLWYCVMLFAMVAGPLKLLEEVANRQTTELSLILKLAGIAYGLVVVPVLTYRLLYLYRERFCRGFVQDREDDSLSHADATTGTASD